MAIREYIGARYVPRFVGTYDPTTLYEALDVVDNGSGTSYIARKNVPVNTPLTDTEYWFVYGASSGAIVQLQNDMIQAQNDITGLQGNVTTINGQITGLDNRLDLLDDKKIVMITDSYGNRLDGNGHNVGDILIAAGVPIVDYHAVSGCGFIQPSPANPVDYLNLYTGDHNKVTDVIFAMSANDNHSDLATILGAMQTAYAAAKSSYPNANIHVIPWGVCLADNSWAAFLQDTTIKAYHQAAQYGYIVADNAQYMLRHTGLLDSDLIHPNAAGVSYIAGQVLGLIKGSTINVEHTIVGALTAATGSGITIASAVTITMRRHNGNVELTGSGASGIFGIFEHNAITTGSLSINPAFILGGSLFSIPQSLSSRYISVIGRERNQGAATFIPANCKFIVFDGTKIRVIIENLTDGTTDRFTASDNTVIITD